MILTTLRRIIQEVNAAQTLPEALDIVVSGVRETMDADACSIFLKDEAHSENALVATDGLNKAFIGKVRLNLGEGIVGLVSERAEPFNLSNAAAHPNYLHYPGLGEEPLKAFLGVPIIHQRHVLGVLAVYQREERCFDESEEAFLVTLSAQLAGIIAHALAIGTLFSNDKPGSQKRDNVLTGVAGAPGIALGTAFVVYPMADISAVPERKIEPEEVENEIIQLKAAIGLTQHSIQALSENMKLHGLPEEERALYNVYLHMLGSKTFLQEITDLIQQGSWAQGALKQVVQKHIARFEEIEDMYLKERASDLRDLGERVLFHLQDKEVHARYFPEQTILVGREITPAALAEVPEGRLAGVVSIKGSSNSHVAILARALGVPTVLGIEGMKISQLENQELIVDGYYGQVYISPSPVLKQEYTSLLWEEHEFDKQLETVAALPAETLDGYEVDLHVNMGLSPEVGKALNIGAKGVGLYRTEVPFMTRERFPGEEEQRVIYRQLLQAFAPNPVIMRTLDVGGDKALSYFPVVEDNPFLGWRGIRITLDHPEIFLVQMRAMLQASVGLDNLKIMFPMITTVNEVEEALRLFRQAYQEVLAEGLTIKKPDLGVMIEVPSAVYQSQVIAKRVDFLSVGSNDLTQYLLAVDRNNARVANLYDSLHPAVIRALMQVVASAHREGKPAGICGEMASDPASAILLLAMGYDSFSMSASALLQTKWVIRHFSYKEARKLLEEVLLMDDAIEIRNHMEQALEEAGLGALGRAGR